MADKGSVTAGISQYIRDNIRAGTWQVGEKIPGENQLCKDLGVSRVSVRGALQQFIALGILESVHGKGTFLISDDLSVFSAPEDMPAENNRESIQSMTDILKFRCIIEPEICGLVAATAEPQLISELERYLTIMQHSIGKNDAFVEADVSFHLEICKATKNPVTISVVQSLFHSRSNLGQNLNLTSGYYGGLYYHGLIVEAMKSHDSKRAKAFMLEHLQRGIDDLRAYNHDSNADGASD